MGAGGGGGTEASLYVGLYGGYIGIMEKKLETTIVFRVQGLLEEVKDLSGVLGYYRGLY